ncbi:MAG: carboxylesterase family protein [Atopobiaceae bacterium]|nr:carboxylesterase family protein [Atopobiaceae bacterium]
MSEFDDAKKRMESLYGENHKIEDGNYDKTCAVKCVNGTFVGKRADDVIAFKGIPFVGKQPSGDLRWKAPVDVVPDDGVYEAYYFGKIPCQVGTVGQMGSLYPQSEDCLFLNVWKADDGNAKKPVMVWIHGGAYELGSTAEPREEGTNFVHENPDVILVSIEYRLNAFGFLHLSHLPDGADYPDAQNLGLMDQLAALKWVHENIAAFGGDPGNVTIFGQSAGGGSVSLLPLAEGSHEYFQKVIAQSGSPAFCRSTEQAIECTDKIMKALGCTTVAELMGLDPDKIVAAASSEAAMPLTTPERDGRFLPLDPYAAYESGAAKDLVIMQGCTKDECAYFVGGVGPELFTPWAEGCKAEKLAQLTKEERALAESFFADGQGEVYENLSRFLDQFWFNAPLIRTAENQVKGGGKTYVYYFRVESSVPMMKSGHAIELSELFNHPEETFVTGRQFDKTFSKTMRKMWVQFAKCGDPSLPADVSPSGKAKEWPLYDLEDKRVMVFDEFDIHVEKESAMNITDRDRTYFLTKYYVR